MSDCCYGGVSSSVTEMDGCSLTTGRSPFSLHCNPRHSVGRVALVGCFLLRDVKNKVVIYSIGGGRDTDQGQEMIEAGHVCSSAVVACSGCQQVTRAKYFSVFSSS